MSDPAATLATWTTPPTHTPTATAAPANTPKATAGTHICRGADVLSVREAMTLQIAAATYTRSGTRDDDYRELVGYGPVRAAQVVTHLLDRADAEAEMPAVVRRLRRVREARARVRTGSR